MMFSDTDIEELKQVDRTTLELMAVLITTADKFMEGEPVRGKYVAASVAVAMTAIGMSISSIFNDHDLLVFRTLSKQYAERLIPKRGMDA